ncbi:porin [Flavobacterium sp. Fl-318]|uniref:Porin n=1 Tax=Flavobacterium cupriresistens TaxID=2893885 RepID=A0ABU4R9G0_9FLAO|nr:MULTISPECIES: porin [unclassified Flavobacterium]MDX6189217.1 porin [Flavobacterium sp. Fl-318]UFH41313.1 OprO/OprP family phosphate-selective porin [Flavobacterium sp. F-323]
MSQKELNLKIYFGVLLLSFCSITFSQEQKDSTKLMNVSYGSKGIQLETRDNKFLFQLQSRLQFRFATPYDQDPLTYDDFNQDNQTAFKINRARLKVGGHAFEPWLKYYWEYELSQSNLLDFRIMIEKWDWMSFKIGQWKTEFTRERFISSGEQQMVERSILNRPFTTDRQHGVEIYGHLKGKGIADFNYWVAALTGTGRGNTKNDDQNLMYFGRAQWNFLGRTLDFEGGDLEFHEKPTAIIALAGVTNRSPYTRFSQAGGGSLEGFEEEKPGQYRVNQYNIESAFMFRGFSWQSEWHHKNIIDRVNNNELTRLRGYYAQAGYFFHTIWPWVPKHLEMAGRHAVYRPDKNFKDNLQRESTVAFNYFFKGHKNKLTGEVSYFDFQDSSLQYTGGWRFRVQWDISL